MASYQTYPALRNLTMEPRSLPGDFILEAANFGLQVAAKLGGFVRSSKSKEFTNKISMSATLLSEVGREVNRNAICFKESFPATFEQLTTKCKQEYEIVLAALVKAMSWKKGESVEGTDELPTGPWKRVILALAMDKDEMEKFEEDLGDSLTRALALQYMVSLVVLQVRAQKQQLSTSELNVLGRLKKGLGIILETMRETNIASVVAFSLTDLSKAANAVQVLEAAKAIAENSSAADDTSIMSKTTTILNHSVENLTPIKKQEMVPMCQPMIIQSPRIEDKYEMFRVSTNVHVKNGSQKVFRIFGIPLKVDRTEREVISHTDKIPASLDEIKAFILKEKDDENTQPASLNSLVNVSPIISTAIYTLINNKNEEMIFPRRTWTTELLVSWEWWEGRRLGRKQKVTDGYIVILRGEVPQRPYARPPPTQVHRWQRGGPPAMNVPPPPSNWPGGAPGGPPVIVNLSRVPTKQDKKNKKEKKLGAHIELTQQETETVINDFLATFSTLYDGIPVEERGAALKAIDLEDADDLVDYDSDDSSSSGSSRSLVDD